MIKDIVLSVSEEIYSYDKGKYVFVVTYTTSIKFRRHASNQLIFALESQENV